MNSQRWVWLGIATIAPLFGQPQIFSATFTPPNIAGAPFSAIETNERILLLADLSRAGQNELLSRTNDLRADIVVAGLPNDDEPLCDALIDAVQPRVIVIADSEFPATRRASRALHERLTQKKIPVIYTRTSGAAKIVTDQSGWELRTMDGQEFQSR